MNIPVTASTIIDRAILLKEGGAIVIPCSSYEEMERLRIRLYKLRKQLEIKHRDIALSLDIRRKASSDKWTVFVTKDAGFSGVFVVEEGEAKPFDIEEIEAELLEEAEKEKEVEVEAEDFDDVAAEIERTQGLVEEIEPLKKGGA